MSAMSGLSYDGTQSQGTEQVINYSDLANISSNLQETASWLTSQIDSLDSDLNSKLSYWTGSAQSAYHKAHEKWKSAATDLAAVMRKIASAVDESNSNYKKTESGIEQQFT